MWVFSFRSHRSILGFARNVLVLVPGMAVTGCIAPASPTIYGSSGGADEDEDDDEGKGGRRRNRGDSGNASAPDESTLDGGPGETNPVTTNGSTVGSAATDTGDPCGVAPTESCETSTSPPGDTTTGVELAPNAGGDFVVSHAWQGYAYIVGPAPTTYTPMNFAARAAGEPLCVNGTVGAGNGNFLELGINLNQPSGNAAPADVTAAGLALRIIRRTPSPLRAQLVSPGMTGMTFWCADLVGEGPYFIRWEDFNTACWDGSGTDYNPADPLRSVAIIVPGAAASPTDFDFCISGYADASTAEDAVLDVL